MLGRYQRRLIDFIQSIELPSFELPSFGGGATGRVPRGARTDIPDLAEGGIVRARPGGRIVRVAERGRDEIISAVATRRGDRWRRHLQLLHRCSWR